jgi:predicted ATP-grasp superfamily ATP-dependent carboligase
LKAHHLKVVVYEHISGGGYAGQPIPLGVLSEGFGMLRSIVSNFKAAGYEVTVLLDARISKLNPPIAVDCTVPVFYPQEPKKFLAKVAKINDAAYIVAPETGQTLQSLVELVEQTGKVSLNCESSAIQKVADKTVLCKILKKNGLPTPKTLVLNVTDDLAIVKRAIKSKLSYPVVFKPMDGVSCGGLSVVKEDAQVEKAIAKIKAESAEKRFIIQEFVEGEAASVSLLSARGKALAISLNKQSVKVAAPEAVSSYEGGTVPFNHPLKQEAFTVAKKVVESYPGLRGYVGVDLVLAQDKPFVVDVNPRLTTSYVGLSRVADFNVAQALVNAALKSELPAKHESHGFACFSKIETPKPTISAFQKAAQISEVVSPPFPLNDNTKACSLIAGHGDSLENARLRFEEAKKRLINIISRGK